MSKPKVVTGQGRTSDAQAPVRDTAGNNTGIVLAALMHACPMGVLCLDLAGQVMEWNQRAEILCGGSKAAMAGCLQALSVSVNGGTRQPLLAVLAGMEGTDRVEVRLHRLDGTWFEAAVVASPIIDANGAVGGRVVFLEDIAAKKAGRELFEASAEEYETIFNLNRDPMFLVAVEGDEFRYRRMNAANIQISGYTNEQIRQKTPRELFGENLGQEVENYYRLCTTTARPVSYVSDRKLATGFRTQHITLTPVLTDGKVTQIVGSAHDLTELKLLEYGLRESEEKFRTLFDSINDNATIYEMKRQGPPGKFIEVNPAICRLLGYTREELLQLTPVDINYQVSSQDLIQIKQELIERGSSTFEVMLSGKNDVRVPVEINSRVISLGGKEVVMSIGRDIRERKLAEARMAHRLSVEKATALVSNRLITREDVDFNEICQVLGQAVQASRAFTYFCDETGVSARKVAEWCNTGVESKLNATGVLHASEQPWFFAKINRNENVIIPDTAVMPPEAVAEQNFFREIGVYSLLDVPIFLPSAGLLGFLGFVDTGQAREWPEEDVRLLQTVSEVVGVYMERKQAGEKIKYLSFHDKLTGLYNKAYFEEELQRLDSERQLPLSIIMGDVNGLKLANDAFGHLEGDRLLVKVADILRSACRKDEIICRWGGDEFVILLPRTDAAMARKVTDRIRLSGGKASQNPLQMSISLGSATKESPEQDIEAIMREAEDRMYRNKLLERQRMRNNVILSLEKTLWERSNETAEHAQRLQTGALAVGMALGMSGSKLDELALLASLHDIGNIAIPVSILLKPAELTREEWEIIQRHPETGYRIAASTPELAPIAYAILAHHEKWDGSGYPQGLKGQNIPLIARIISIVDAYDVMTHRQPYRAAMSHHLAVAELVQCAGSQFDASLVDIFIGGIEAPAAGSIAAATREGREIE